MNPFDRDSTRRRYVDVTVVEFAAHTAYLDPVTGTGYLVTPRPQNDVPAPEDPLVEAAWSDCLGGRTRDGLSLYDADRREGLAHLAEEGWEPLLDEAGEIEEAGWTTDGRRALCLYAMPTAGEPCVEALHHALTALDIASDVHVRVRRENSRDDD
ncbi:hypothetical protein OHA18_42110 [Kribbella sp. NBC_00709]|uniref:hypothetical protein n=1 Tax=Kribbella sp. NBC_00709 TaxID=2975972 RepID=UPI002E289603|nr:hypothetical protein [Kribbella sp. NBC_00709]